MADNPSVSLTADSSPCKGESLNPPRNILAHKAEILLPLLFFCILFPPIHARFFILPSLLQPRLYAMSVVQR